MVFPRGAGGAHRTIGVQRSDVNVAFAKKKRIVKLQVGFASDRRHYSGRNLQHRKHQSFAFWKKNLDLENLRGLLGNERLNYVAMVGRSHIVRSSLARGQMRCVVEAHHEISAVLIS